MVEGAGGLTPLPGRGDPGLVSGKFCSQLPSRGVSSLGPRQKASTRQSECSAGPRLTVRNIFQRDEDRAGDDSVPFPALPIADCVMFNVLRSTLHLKTFSRSFHAISTNSTTMWSPSSGPPGLRYIRRFSSSVLHVHDVRKISVRATIGGNSQPDRGGNETVAFVGLRSRHDTMRNFPRVHQLLTALARNDFAIGRENRRDADEVAIGDTGASQRLLERGQLFPMDADSSREKLCVGTIVSSPLLRPPRLRGRLTTQWRVRSARRMHWAAVVPECRLYAISPMIFCRPPTGA